MSQGDQNFPKESVKMMKQRTESRADADLPGERKIQEAPGMASQGSARQHAEVMDRLTGDSAENRNADFKRGKSS